MRVVVKSVDILIVATVAADAAVALRDRVGLRAWASYLKMLSTFLVRLPSDLRCSESLAPLLRIRCSMTAVTACMLASMPACPFADFHVDYFLVSSVFGRFSPISTEIDSQRKKEIRRSSPAVFIDG